MSPVSIFKICSGIVEASNMRGKRREFWTQQLAHHENIAAT